MENRISYPFLGEIKLYVLYKGKLWDWICLQVI